MLGLAMYAVAPLGLNVRYSTRPWLHGSAADPVVALAWILLFGAPFDRSAPSRGGAAMCRTTPARPAVTRAWQGVAAGLVSGGVGALFVTVLGIGTTALMLRSAWVRGWLYHGQHLTASAVYGRELYASQDVASYILLLIGFPIIGLMMGLTGGGTPTRPARCRTAAVRVVRRAPASLSRCRIRRAADS